MSLSQKHAGLILVPWFSSEEWRYVYQLIYSGNKESEVKALEVLKIWKMRTPILSAGVEGTLILLDVLLVDTESLSDEHISNLHAVALMRFLNLSAANSEKQGSFTKTSVKNELPKWLINLRNDIAHGHQIPSKCNLKMGLDFGLSWLKERYWDPQSKIISDYYTDNDFAIDIVTSVLNTCVNVYSGQSDFINLDSEFYERITNMVHKKVRRRALGPYIMLEVLLEMISQSFEIDHQGETINKCLDILVSSRALLNPNLTQGEGSGGFHGSIWKSLIDLLHLYGKLFCLIDRLFNVIADISYSKQAKKMASTWINVIIISLQNLEEEGNREHLLYLHKNEHTYKEERSEFQNKVLCLCNEDISCYIADFLDNLLKYNSTDTDFRLDVLNLIKVESSVENLHKAEHKIYTVENLKIPSFPSEGAKVTKRIVSGQDEKQSEGSRIIEKQIVGGSKWKKIEDTSIFKGCPLGVLPHQIGPKHPFLILE